MLNLECNTFEYINAANNECRCKEIATATLNASFSSICNEFESDISDVMHGIIALKSVAFERSDLTLFISKGRGTNK